MGINGERNTKRKTSKMITSKRYRWNLQDVLKGLLIAALASVAAFITDSINEGSITFNWRDIGFAALTGASAYMTKNFFSPAKKISSS